MISTRMQKINSFLLLFVGFYIFNANQIIEVLFCVKAKEGTSEKAQEAKGNFVCRFIINWDEQKKNKKGKRLKIFF